MPLTATRAALACALALLLEPGLARAQGGTLRVALPALPASLDPALAAETSSGLLARQLFDSLLQYREGSSDVEPALAAQWRVSRDGLTWSFRLREGVRFHDGDVEEFKRLSARCMEIVRTQDTGTLQYDTYFNDDETECIVIERFRDADALIQHGENLAHLMDAIIGTGSVSGELLGEPSAEVRASISGDGPVQLFTPWVRM